MVRIYETNGGRCWRIYAPGKNYSMLDRRTERGAIAYAKRNWPTAGIEVIYAN